MKLSNCLHSRQHVSSSVITGELFKFLLFTFRPLALSEFTISMRIAGLYTCPSNGKNCKTAFNKSVIEWPLAST